MSDPKETWYFSHEDRWQRGIGWYSAFFISASEGMMVGEASTTYTMHPSIANVPQRIAQCTPNAKLVYMIRDPIERLVSHYQHLWYAGETEVDLQSEIKRNSDLLDFSRYYMQIEQFLPYFPPDRWKVLLFEEFRSRAQSVLSEVYGFLGVAEDYVPPDQSVRNATAGKVRASRWVDIARRVPGVVAAAHTLVPPGIVRRVRDLGGKRLAKPQLSSSLRASLEEQLCDDVDTLSEFLGRDLRDIWKFSLARRSHS